ncbi:hypothetical protein AN5227.2 [Aspergillus nidulans FGSC A4]|uniref:Integrase catalytic domain-containing protein n=1 Tax=Emericella nidulans (strain FGSC A4 / ATCC 38163 / CBS 112.46 / NRRL 194 / M139) TaxID=227321 RepID=Q5B2K3_EMENI|nr:hypothetical protein [Aspergillus nidulans FGSC A4]EAA62408.1 hypothetical protein AN5227.2 [Aspergillus nidulans FGSC A4]CBF81124.1 TPA: conserved hypothetical protein [Aspergillus nidulans FGSC A4]|eukprot:XP_662831.1 hypothetical protein AN5227.2 [Aspergillus nidulans FGSC A4]
MMEDTRAKLRRQLREELGREIVEELRDEIRREIHEDASYDRNMRIQQLDLLYRERKRIWKLAKSKFRTRRSVILSDRHNYITWRDSVLMDAYIIDAKDIFVQTKPPNGSNEIDIACWDAKNVIMRTRILQSIASHVRETICRQRSTLAAELWARIASTYAPSTAEERLVTVKALLDINPQGNYPAMIRDYQRIGEKLRRMDLSFEDLIHDIFICSLGQWQQDFVHTKLDEFYSCGRGPIKNLDITTFAGQLVARSSPSSNKCIPQHPPRFKLEARYRISPTELKDSPRTKQGCQGQKPMRTKVPLPNDCRELHPEKASDDKNQPKGQKLVLRNHPQANSIASELAQEPKHDNEPPWLLSTAADFHISYRDHVFSNLRDHEASIKDAGGHVHQIIGIGTALVHGMEIPDVRYAPAMKTNLLSFGLLDKQNFDISLHGNFEKHFLIKSPTGDSLGAYLEQETGRYHVRPVSDGQKDHDHALPTATMSEWHQRLSHVHFRAILKFEQQKILKIKGRKTLAFCDICRQAKQRRQISKEPASRATKILARIHIVIAGGGATLNCKDEQAPPGIENTRYFLLITDDATRYRWFFTLRTTDEAIPTFQWWIKHIKNQGFSPPAFVRSDREFFTDMVKKLCQICGLVLEPTTADSPWQNGVSERGIQPLLQSTRAMISDSGLPRWLWPQALETAVYHLNRLPTQVPLYNDRRSMAPTSDPEIQPCAHLTPYSAWNNGDANIKHLVKFGSPAWMHLHEASKHAGKPTSMIDPKAKKVHIVGYRGTHFYVVWDPETNQLHDTSNVSINEVFRPPQSKPYGADKTNKDPPTHDPSDINSRDKFQRSGKGSAILKSTNSLLPEPGLSKEATKALTAQWLVVMRKRRIHKALMGQNLEV